MKKISLPLAKPIITSYPTTTAVLSIILTESSSLPWFYNNFIQLYSRGKEFIQTGLEFYNDFIFKFCPLIAQEHLTSESIEILDIDVVIFMLRLLEKNKYIFVYLDMFHIRAYTQAYQKKHDYHAALIYGFDSEEKIFYIADFFNGKYSYETATYEEICSGYYSMGKFNLQQNISGINVLSFNKSPFGLYEKEKWIFNAAMVSTLIQDYLSSKDSYAILGTPKENLICGIEVYNVLIENLNEIHNGNKKLSEFHIKPFHISWNHKTVMLDRIKYMGELGVLKNYKKLYDDYKEIVTLSLITRNIALKSFITNDASLMISVSEKLHYMISQEKLILQDLVNQLE
ncbi:hypothetical protein [Paenibacillus oryzisoli]|uniref:Butirosin biosynthesis protein H N-terminal domain-containing protein n=1 Tax=Paenibacillus oryzisoli TaxID=1850517 RepID=A0A198A9U8_9BACL|nr:hypothetical protein [Paenibacillus oryzisoli]OAS17728.1 hypothetical protein A8708_14640 [Paenibacillus oryzisoli]